MTCFLGIDVGSSGCKVIAVDETGRVAARAAQPYPTRYPRPGWAEQEPEEWYRAACQAVRACLAEGNLDPGQVAALSVDGPAHNVALLDSAGRVLYPTIHWSDLRSAPQCDLLKAEHGDRIFEITYQPVNPSWTLAQLLWLKENEPSVWSNLRRILVTKDYVRYRLTGSYLTDPYDAVGMQLFDLRAGRWSSELCAILGLDPGWLPPVLPPQAAAGELLPEPALETGLRAGIPVAVGSGDSVVEAFGVGAVNPGQCLLKIASAANVDLVTARPLPTSKTITYPHLIRDRWFSITATNSGASTVRWFANTFCRYEVGRGASAFDLVDSLAAGAPPGCEGLLFHPYLMGERSPYWDPFLRGDFVGISANHQVHHFARAVLEGVAFSIRDCSQVIEQLGQPVSARFLIGGGARSRLWRQILCDVIGQPLRKPAVEDAAFGAALLAGVAFGYFPDWEAAVQAGVRIEETLQPDPGAYGIYNELFEIYRSVTRNLAENSGRLARLADRKPKDD